jgi:hypothetical protein
MISKSFAAEIATSLGPLKNFYKVNY